MQLRQVNIWREEQAGKGPGSEMRVGDVRALLPGVPWLVLTATASREVQIFAFFSA